MLISLGKGRFLVLVEFGNTEQILTDPADKPPRQISGTGTEQRPISRLTSDTHFAKKGLFWNPGQDRGIFDFQASTDYYRREKKDTYLRELSNDIILSSVRTYRRIQHGA